MLNQFFDEYRIYKQTHTSVLNIPLISQLIERTLYLEKQQEKQEQDIKVEAMQSQMAVDNTTSNCVEISSEPLCSSSKVNDNDSSSQSPVIEELHKKCQAAESENEQLSKTIEARSHEITMKNEQINRLHSQINSLESRLSELSTELQVTKKRYEAMEASYVSKCSAEVHSDEEEEVKLEIKENVRDPESEAEEEEEQQQQQQQQQQQEDDDDEEEQEEEEEEEEEDDEEEEEQQQEEQQQQEEEEEEQEEEQQQQEEEEQEEEEQQQEEQQQEEEEEEEVSEVTINGKTYFTTNEKNGIIYECVDDEVGDEVGVFKNGVATFHKKEVEQVVPSSESEEEEEEEEEVFDIKINGKTYFTTNEKNGIIYSCVDDEVGDEVGVFKNGVATFHKKK
jgi:hypothetical protein